MTELVQTLLLAAADTLPLWRGPVVMLLAVIAVACLWFAAEATGE